MNKHIGYKKVFLAFFAFFLVYAIGLGLYLSNSQKTYDLRSKAETTLLPTMSPTTVFNPPVRIDEDVPLASWGNIHPNSTIIEDGREIEGGVGDDGYIVGVWTDTRFAPSDPMGNDSAIFYSMSTDKGLSWSKNSLVNNDGEYKIQDRASTAVCMGNIVVSWQMGGEFPTSSLYVSTLGLPGSIWTPAVQLGSSAANVRLAVDPKPTNCRFYAVWRQYDPTDIERIKIAYSDNAGKAWSSPITVSSFTGKTSQMNPEMVVDTAGNIHVVWMGDYPENNIFYNRSSDGGKTWLQDEQVNEKLPGIAHSGAYVVILNDVPFVGWTDNRSGKKNSYIAWRNQDGWSDAKLINSSSINTHNALLDLSVTKGWLVASWYTFDDQYQSDRTIKVARSQDGQTWEAETVIDSGTGLLSNSGLNINSYNGWVTLIYGKADSATSSSHIYASGGQYISQSNPTPTLTPTPATALSCKLLYVKILTSLETSCNSPKYDPKADLNKDKNVNSVDISLFKTQTSEGTNGAVCTAYLSSTINPCLATSTP